MFLMCDYLCALSLGLLYIFVVISSRFWVLFSQYWPRDWLTRASPKWPILCGVGCKTNQSHYAGVLNMLQVCASLFSTCCERLIKVYRMLHTQTLLFIELMDWYWWAIDWVEKVLQTYTWKALSQWEVSQMQSAI